IMDNIQENCIQSMELIRLSCENHFYQMQDFMRVQIDINGEIKTNSINILIFLADIFEKYYKIMNETNFNFGLQVLHTLIELIQGPCIENQNVLCHTKLLENLEDIIGDFIGKSQRFTQKKLLNQRIFTQFSRKVLLTIRSLFVANQDKYIIRKIAQQVDGKDYVLKMNQSYKQYLQTYQKIRNKHEGLKKSFQISKNEKLIEYVLNRDDKNEENSNLEYNEGFGEFQDQNLVKSNQKIQDFDKNNNNSLHISKISANQKKCFENERGLSFKEQNLIYFIRADEYINEGFDCYILLKNLQFLDQNFKNAYNLIKQKIVNYQYKQKYLIIIYTYKDLKQCLNFFKQNTLSIEIINQQGNLQKIYFRKPKLIKYFSTTSKQRFLHLCDRETANQKIQGLLRQYPSFLDEMNHFLFLNSKGLFFNLTYLSRIRNFNLIIILIINLIFLQFFQLSISVIIFIIWVVFQFPLEYKSIIRIYTQKQHDTKKKLQEKSELRKKSGIQKQINKLAILIKKFFYIMNDFLFSSHLLYLIISILFSVLGISSSPLFFCLLLLDIIDRSVVLRNVIKSITLNSVSLIMTAILGIVIVYIYAIAGFFNSDLKNSFVFKGNNDDMKVCETPIDCFILFLNLGLRSGGGIGDAFYNDQKNRCFICNQERSDFENDGINFKKHTEQEHHIWNYLAYIILIDKKDLNEYDAVESYIKQLIVQQDVSWFPIGKSLSLQKVQLKQQEEDNIVKNQKEFLEKNKKINNL
ncbi:inositol -triphosphate type 1 isoform 3, putative, partial [Ichthyophthirius multifiliis]